MEEQIRQMRAGLEDAGLACPGTATLMLTNRCNLVCRHCMPESRSDERSPGAAAVAVTRVIDGFAGLGRQTGVAFTEMRHNFDELPRLIRILDGMGIHSLVSGTLLRKGRAGRTGRIALPAPSQYASLLARYHADPGFRRRYRRSANIAALEWFLGKTHPGAAGCRCMETPYINSDGVMFPCTMLAVDELGVEGVFSRPLTECLQEAAGLWAGLNDLHRRRAETLAPCLSCPGRQHCRGGCMGRAHTAFGSFMAVEDRCRLRREVYAWTP